jgi:hypothetical protein
VPGDKLLTIIYSIVVSLISGCKITVFLPNPYVIFRQKFVNIRQNDHFTPIKPIFDNKKRENIKKKKGQV